MGVEIERKFLVQGDDWKAGQVGVAYRQGYLSSDPERTVRVRMAGEEGFLTIKGAARSGARREFEYRVPAAEAEQMLDGPVTASDIERLSLAAEQAWLRVEQRGLEWMMELGAQLSDEQMADFIAELRERQTKYEKK